MSKSDLPLSFSTAVRMGYEHVAAAATVIENNTTIEYAVVGPGGHLPGWSLVTHVGTDPDNPTAGTSGVEQCTSRADAEEQFLAEITRDEVNIAVPGYAVGGVTKTDGRLLWVGSDQTGWPTFASGLSDAEFHPNIESAELALKNFARPGIQSTRDLMVMSSFGIFPMSIVTRKLAISEEARIKASSGTVPAPHGWDFAIANPLRTLFSARRIMSLAPPGHLATFPDLQATLKRAGELTSEYQPILVSRRAADVKLTKDQVERIRAGEKALRAQVIPADDLGEEATFRL